MDRQKVMNYGARLLIMDDDSDGLTALTYRLHRAFDRSIIIDTADYVALGVLLAHTHGYDAILLKLFIPDRLRVIFFGQLRRIRPQALIVMIGGVNPKGDSEEAGHLDGVRWMSHPLDFGQLRAMMTSLYQTSSVRQQARKRRRSHPFALRCSLPLH